MEQRLIDANALLGKQEALYMKGHVLFHGVTSYTIENAPTIDTETLPIVQELREKVKNLNIGIENLSQVLKIAYEQRDNFKEKLERVTAEREAAQHRWIPCSEQLPEPGKSVLVWCPECKNTYCAYHKNGTWFIFCDCCIVVNEMVDCWIPVPRPQKEE